MRRLPHAGQRGVRSRQTSRRHFRPRSAPATALGRLASDPAEKAALERVQRGLPEWQTFNSQYLRLARMHDFPAAHEIMLERIYPLVGEVEKAAGQVRDIELRSLAAAQAGAAMAVRSAVWRASGVMAVSGVIAGAILLLIRRIASLLRRSSRKLRR